LRSLARPPADDGVEAGGREGEVGELGLHDLQVGEVEGGS
jgi:hypothetical protein